MIDLWYLYCRIVTIFTTFEIYSTSFHRSFRLKQLPIVLEVDLLFLHGPQPLHLHAGGGDASAADEATVPTEGPFSIPLGGMIRGDGGIHVGFLILCFQLQF